MDSVPAMDAYIASLGFEITRLQAQVVAAKKKRNRLTPLCGLPPEILGRIISYTQYTMDPEDPSSSDDHLEDFGYNSAWKDVLLTCAYVYKVGLTTPGLWTHVDLAWSTQKINAHLSRAGAGPLVATWTPSHHREYGEWLWDQTTDTDVTAMDVAAACFRRAGAAWISLLGSMNEDKVGIVPVLDHQSPDLHSLHVLLHGSRVGPFFESLKLYPALVELSIEHSNLMG
jgi:hypothetical protein